MKIGTDEGWEYAMSFSSKFHDKERKMDSVRRRRWHRNLKPLTKDADNNLVISIGTGEKSKEHKIFKRHKVSDWND
ncbi:hypothetical protein Ciccas_003459 [Cichlidogyrus casuarinus]|uniref:Peroxin/Ferlin domain-containing protein n=1 Tax=Cichlidogyrus casuarinus TaxID=1844966 RepID=A0ABD2QEB3_9PLAT